MPGSQLCIALSYGPVLIRVLCCCVFTLAEAPLSGVASAGMKWTMMRHGNKVKHLGRPADQRKALIRSLVTEVLRHGQIRTTKVSFTSEECNQ